MMEGNMTAWIKAAGIRALKTTSQTAVSMIGIGLALSEIDWIHVVSVSLVAGVLSILTSLAGLPEVEKDEKRE